jgi:hypothetical protein
MTRVPFHWSIDVGHADWWTRVLHPFAQDVGSIMPDVFPDYARVLRRVNVGHSLRTWTEIAAENGRIAHAEMQFHEINRPLGDKKLRGYQPNLGGQNRFPRARGVGISRGESESTHGDTGALLVLRLGRVGPDSRSRRAMGARVAGVSRSARPRPVR